MSIATKTGDKGETSLMYGRRVPKTDHRVDAYGCVDELNSALGLARAALSNEFVRSEILAAQKELITVMGELATSPEDLERYRKDGFQITTDAMVDRVNCGHRRAREGQITLSKRLGYSRRFGRFGCA